MGRTSNDGQNIQYGGDGRVESVNGQPVERGMSGTAR